MNYKRAPTIVLEPPVRRGMQQLDRDQFTISVPVIVARVRAPNTTDFVKGKAKEHVLWLPRIGPVLEDSEMKDHRRIMLKGDSKDAAELVDLAQDSDVELLDHEIQVKYDYWTADQILQSVLPESLLDESPTSFTQVGHIAHLNLRDEYLPHRHLIGQVILDKNKTLRTVVNKLDTIDNEFRNFKMEVLAGDEDFIVHTHESGCTFKFDFSQVYWNSRLQGEHARLVESFSPHDVVCDAFAGVGPFAIPAGKKGCGVLASDLNPSSASALADNAKTNKVLDTVRTGNADARDFIRDSVLDLWQKPFPAYRKPLSARARSRAARQKAVAKETHTSADPAAAAASPSVPPSESARSQDQPPIDTATETLQNTGPPRRLIDHFVMNLPALAIEFLDAFRGLYRPLYALPNGEGQAARAAVQAAGDGALPLVHCYCFTKDMDDQEGDILRRASKALGLPVTPSLLDYKLRFVRDVAPKKEMYCLEFRLTRQMVEDES